MEDDPFEAEHCAALHNEILQRAIAHRKDNPGGHAICRDLVSRMREHMPVEASWVLDTDRKTDVEGDDDDGNDRAHHDRSRADGVPETSMSREQSKIHRFFTLLDSFEPDALPLTAEFRQPNPLSMSLSASSHGDLADREIILLYPNNLSDAFRDGGLYLEVNTFYATTWQLDLSGLPSSDSDSWLPLHLVLTKMLHMWDLGKFQWDASRLTVGFVPWVARDLEDALDAWGNLLSTIEQRMPESSQPTSSSEPMLPVDLVEQYEISPFSRAFLSRATRPCFRFIAPGLTTFTPNTFTTVMDLEADDSPRRRFNASIPETSDMFASLLFPSASDAVPPSTPDDPTFDRDWGVGKFTISRRPGLYTDPLQGDQFADGTLLITDLGMSNPWSFANKRPWGVARPLTLVEMLEAWADCVRSGAWDVGADGVRTQNHWFTDPKTKEDRTLPWLIHSR